MAVFFQRRDHVSPFPRGRSRPRLEALEERTLLSAYSDAVLADAPSGYWRIGEFKGSDAADSSGLERHGTYVGKVGLGMPGAIVDDKDTAAGFDGNKTFVEVAGKPFNFLVNYTLEAWVINPGQIEPNPVARIISNGQPGSRGYGWGLRRVPEPAENTIRFTTYGIRDYDSDVIVPIDGAYHHVVVTFDENFVATFYLDGTFQQALSWDVAPRPSDLNFSIGRNPPTATPPENWNGTIDEVAVYEYVLTGDQVLNHYLIGTGGGRAPGPGQTLPVLAIGIGSLTMADLTLLAGGETGNGLDVVATAVPQRERLEPTMVPADQLFASLTAGEPVFLSSPAEAAGHRADDPWCLDGFAMEEVPLVV